MFVALLGVLWFFSLDLLAKRHCQSVDLIIAPLSSFAEINDLYASSLSSLIVAGIVDGILLTVAVRSFVLLSDRFAIIHSPKRFRQRHHWIGRSALGWVLFNAFLQHSILDWMLSFATVFLGSGLLITVLREESSAANSIRLLYLRSIWRCICFRPCLKMINVLPGWTGSF